MTLLPPTLPLPLDGEGWGWAWGWMGDRDAKVEM